jgi:hypothetical protein
MQQILLLFFYTYFCCCCCRLLLETESSNMPIWNQARAVVLAVAIASTCGFAPQPKTYRYSPPSKLFAQTKSPPAIPAPLDVSYGEESRKYRRTVFSHADWEGFRSPDRFIRNLTQMPSSGIYKNLARELIATTGVAAFCFVFNMLTGDYTDFGGVTHAGILKDTMLPLLTLSLTPFTLLSPSLGLLLGEFQREQSLVFAIFLFPTN